MNHFYIHVLAAALCSMISCARKRIAKNIFSDYRESYDNLTNDYYWTIIHEAEPMPEGYF